MTRHAPREATAPALAWARTRALLPTRADLAHLTRQPRRDVLAGMTVAAVALPLAMAFGITSGLGAKAGLVTAVVAGFVAALFGGSNVQVSGPTGAMTVVLGPIVVTHGANGVLVVGLLAGLLLVVLAYSGAGRYVRLIPLPVIEGFTAGIAVIIALQQVPAALGVRPRGSRSTAVALHAVRDWVRSPHWIPLLTAFAVAVLMLLVARRRPSLPVSLLLVLLTTVVVRAADIRTPLIGTIPRGLAAPRLPDTAGISLQQLLGPAVAVAALAALESLLSATVADAMSVGERHDPDREFFGQGMANLVTPLFGGIPATAAIARTAVNVRSGAQSRLAAMTQSLALLAVVLVAARWVSYVPLAALAGVLLATAAQMVQASSLLALLRSTRSDAVVLVITATATVLFDLVTAVLAGLVLAGALALRELARSARVDETPLDHSDHSDEERALLRQHVVAFRIDGPLFFGAAHASLLELAAVQDVRVVVLRMSRVVALDATGAAVLADTVKRLEARGITVLLSGVRDEHSNVLARLGVYDQLAHERHLFRTTPEAIAHAQLHAARTQHLTTTP
jgi:MFS superfamily sulfate permease-like transporter